MYNREAILLFSTSEDDHFTAFERACLVENELPQCKSAKLVTYGQLKQWRTRPPVWAKKLVRSMDAEPRLLADEKARQSERVQQLARDKEIEKKKNVQLEAARAEEARGREQEELRANALKAANELMQDELNAQEERTRRTEEEAAAKYEDRDRSDAHMPVV